MVGAREEIARYGDLADGDVGVFVEARQELGVVEVVVEATGGNHRHTGVGDGVASMYNDFSRRGDNGHFVLALDISRFMPLTRYHERFDGLVAMVKASGGHVLLPGEVRWENWREAEAHGIEVNDANWDAVLNGQAAATS